MMLFKIREVSPDDFEICADVIRQSFATVAKDFGLTTQNCPTYGAFLTSERLVAYQENGNLMYAISANDNMVGFMQLVKKSDTLFDLEKLAVLPAYRHFGCGKLLVDFAKAKAKELGASKISLTIIEENEVIKNWYMINGFHHTGTQKFDHLPFTVGFMEIDLKSEIV